MDYSDNFGNGSTPNPVNNSAEEFCRQVLVQRIGQISVRIWDLVILIPNLLFFFFLLYKLPKLREKLKREPSPVYKGFYILVYLITTVNIIRCMISMCLGHPSSETWGIVDKVFWLILKFFMLSAELSILTFSLFFGHLDSRISVRRVLYATVLVALVFSTVQSLLEFKFPDKHYKQKHNVQEIDLFSHGGMVFWLAVSVIAFLIYVTICVLPFTSLARSGRIALPTRRLFYVYCTFLALINFIQVVGCALVESDRIYGMCFVDLTSYCYFAFYTPLVYYAFIKGHLPSSSSRLPFAYRQYSDKENDNSYGEQMPEASHAYLPALPGITSPSFDDLLIDPEGNIFDSTDFDSSRPETPRLEFSSATASAVA